MAEDRESQDRRTPEHEMPLQQAKRHVHEGEERVSRQEARIEELRRAGRDTTNAVRFLEALQATLRAMREHAAKEERIAAGDSR